MKIRSLSYNYPKITMVMLKYRAQNRLIYSRFRGDTEMKKLALFLALLLVMFTVPAFAFIVDVPEETIFVPLGTSREVDFKIHSSRTEDISFTVLDAKPWITQSASQVRAIQDDPVKISVFITPFDDTQPSVYRFTLLFEAASGEQQKKFLFVSVDKLDLVEIEKIEVSGNFTPNNQVNVVAYLKNYKSKVVQDIRMTSSIQSPTSKLIEFDQIIDNMDPGETKNISFSFTLPRQTEAGLYSANVKISADGVTREKSRTFTVIKQAQFTKEASQRPSIFGFTRVLTVTNIGNTDDNVEVTEILSPLDSAFYSGPTPNMIKDSEFTWLLSGMRPGETRVLEYGVNYSPLFLFIIVIIIAAWVFLFKVRTVRIRKFMLEKKFIEEGEQFTVGVEIRNSTGKKLDDVTLKDFVPSVFEIKDGEGPKPARKKMAAGTELTWKLKDLHNNEERILSYKILPVFGVHGTLRLPQASAEFVRGKKPVEIKSMYTSIGIETENYGEKRHFMRKK